MSKEFVHRATGSTIPVKRLRIDHSRAVQVKWALFDPEITAKIPKRSSEHAAGFDLFSAYEHGPLNEEESMLVRTNIVMAIPNGWVGKIYPRSGLATKHQIRLSNCVGIIDSDYRGEIMVPLHRDVSWDSDGDPVLIEKYMKIAQIVFEPVHDVYFEHTDLDKLGDTQRGAGGFGSTGSK